MNASRSSNQGSNTWRLIGAIVLVLLLLVLWWMGRGPSPAGCCGDVVPPPPVVAAPIAAKINAVWDGTKITLTGELATEADKKRLLDAANASYGVGNVIDKLTVRAGLAALASVTLTGMVPSEADKTERGEAAAKAFAPATIDNQLLIKAPLAPVVAAVAQAVAPDCSKAMQLRVTFDTGSAALTSEDKRYLDDVVKCVTSPMLVGGHTDNVGGDASNLVLSNQRAASVKDYLVGKGVASNLLSTQGFGERKPMADNGSAEGRASNRRIELTAK